MMRVPTAIGQEVLVSKVRLCCYACQAWAVVDVHRGGSWMATHYQPVMLEALIQLPDGNQEWLPAVTRG